MKQKLQNKDMLSPLFNYGKVGLILNQFGLDYIVPTKAANYNKTEKYYGLVKIDKTKFTTKPGWSDPKNTPPEKMLSSIAVNADEIQKGIPVISLVIDKDNLNGATGLFANSYRRGRNWERLCFVSYFDKGKLQFATAAGVRIHGGSSRKRPPYSFRLYFRKKYGAAEFKADIFNESCKPIKRLVLHNDLRRSHFSNPLAYDVSGKTVCFTPATKPVVLFLNGKRYMHGAFVLTERIDKQYFKNHFGSKKYKFIDTQGEKIGREKNSNVYLPLKDWAADKSRKMDIKYAGETIDIENLTNWWISQLICANSDHFQGIQLRRKNDNNAKWFWINWDMDRSFYNLDSDEKNKLKNFWEQKIVLHEVVNGITGKSRKDVRGIVFRRLYHEDPVYKEYFAHKMMETLNHKVTDSFIKSRLDYYYETALSFEISTDFIDQISLFFKHRPAFIRQLMQEYFNMPQSFKCEIKNPVSEDTVFIIDGYEEKNYTGWYFKNDIISVKIKNTENKKIDWLINGRKVSVSDNNLIFSITDHTEISPIIQ